jgi:hypothetical protein
VAQASATATGYYSVNLTLDKTGTQTFADVTR